MSNRLVELGTLVIAGLVLAHAIAVALPEYSPPRARWPRSAAAPFDGPIDGYWYAHLIESASASVLQVGFWPDAPAEATTLTPEELIPSWSSLNRDRLAARLATGHTSINQRAHGWPFRMLRATYFGGPSGRDTVVEGTKRADGSVMPTRMIVPGLIANTLLYAAVCAVPWLALRGRARPDADAALAAGRRSERGSLR